jgi:hypothetical protein
MLVSEPGSRFTLRPDALDRTSPVVGPRVTYVSRLATRAALYSDFRTLVASVPAGASRESYRRAVIEENVLGRATHAARSKAWKELAPRYGIDEAAPLFGAFLYEEKQASSEKDHATTAYLLFALHDRLVTDLGIDWLYDYLRTAPAELRTADVIAFLTAREPTHPEIAAWSRSSRENIASHYLSALKEFGLARGAQKKVSVRPSPGAPPVRFLLRALLLSGQIPLAAVQSPLFRLLGLSVDETVELLFRLNAEGTIRFRMQGDVVEIDLGVPNGS